MRDSNSPSVTLISFEGHYVKNKILGTKFKKKIPNMKGFFEIFRQARCGHLQSSSFHHCLRHLIFILTGLGLEGENFGLKWTSFSYQFILCINLYKQTLITHHMYKFT